MSAAPRILRNRPVHRETVGRPSVDETVLTVGAEAPEITETDIAQRAYQLWEGRGCPDGYAEEDWFQAENELRAR
jgi:hypothetical protein